MNHKSPPRQTGDVESAKRGGAARQGPAGQMQMAVDWYACGFQGGKSAGSARRSGVRDEVVYRQQGESDIDRTAEFAKVS